MLEQVRFILFLLPCASMILETCLTVIFVKRPSLAQRAIDWTWRDVWASEIWTLW